MAGRSAIAAAALLAAVAGAGCSSVTATHSRATQTGPTQNGATQNRRPPRASATANVCRPAHRGTPPSQAAADPAATAAWPERTLLRETVAELSGSQVIDPATGAAYALISLTTRPERGNWVLCRLSLRTGSVRHGPTFTVGGLDIASGYLWVYGVPAASSRPLVFQVDPATMARVRSVRLPTLPPQFPGPWPAITAGPGDSVWIGSNRTLLRLAARTGATLASVTLPPGLLVSDISVDPGGRAMYVSAAHLVHGGMGGNVMFEYDARSGRLLVTRSRGLITYSVAGAQLTAVPGGVWVSFRTGMLGLTLHLRMRDLRMIAPPGRGIALRPATGLFHWPMYETTAYGGGALWLANQRGIVACLDPRTGRVRAREQVSGSQLIFVLAVDPARPVIIVQADRGIAQITPPSRCWG